MNKKEKEKRKRRKLAKTFKQWKCEDTGMKRGREGEGDH